MKRFTVKITVQDEGYKKEYGFDKRLEEGMEFDSFVLIGINEGKQDHVAFGAVSPVDVAASLAADEDLQEATLIAKGMIDALNVRRRQSDRVRRIPMGIIIEGINGEKE